MNSTIRSTATILAAAALAIAGPLQAQDKPVVTATPTSPTVVDLGWTAPVGATQYRVQRGPAASGPWSVVVPSTPLLAYTDATAQPATTYAYRVRARWPGGETVVSDPVSVTTPTAGAPRPPAGGAGKPAGGGLGAEQNPPAMAIGPALQDIQSVPPPDDADPLPDDQAPSLPSGAMQPIQIPAPDVPTAAAPAQHRNAAAAAGAMSPMRNLTCDIHTGLTMGFQDALFLNAHLTGGPPEFLETVGVAYSIVREDNTSKNYRKAVALFPGLGGSVDHFLIKQNQPNPISAQLTVDPDNAITETNEADNTCTWTWGS